LATVITNLLSAIPWLGKSLVEFLKCEKPKFLETIGIVHKNALKRTKIDLNIDKKEYLFIPYSFVAFLVGLIDGDGYIQIGKTGKGYISLKLVISLHLKDLATLEYIHSVIKLGKITTYKDLRSPTCKLIINKTDLQEVFFPLLIYHNVYFLTIQRALQYNMAMYIIKENITSYYCIPKSVPSRWKLPVDAKAYVNLPFFNNWIVGFVVAEGSFFMKENNDGCFQIKQKMHYEMFEAFKIVFKTKRKINIDKLYNSQFGVSSKIDIQRVIDFFSFSGLHPLVGLKCVQYLSWLENLSKSIRYKNLKFPFSSFSTKP
jgi:LAGLIDADG endonuclease